MTRAGGTKFSKCFAARHPRMVAFVSEIEPGVFVVEPMHFLTLTEARREARHVTRFRRQIAA